MSASTRAVVQQIRSALAAQKAGNAASGREPQENHATTFLLAEHTRLCALYLETRETADRRTTLFLTLTTTIVGVLVAAFQFKLAPRDFLETALAAAVGVVVLGAITFHRLLERSMQGTEYLRAINRIHRYFVERAPETEPYLYWPAFDDLPAYDLRGVGGAEQREIVVIIDGLFSGAMVALVVLIVDPSQVLVAAGAGVVGGLLAVLLHRQYEHLSMKREERRKKSQIRFPHDKA
ncbi:MAG: hypothetical protein WCF84_02640 [Anaerolineae bacterium]